MFELLGNGIVTVLQWKYLLPLLLLPLLVPVLIASVTATASLLVQEPAMGWTAMKFLIGFDVIYLAASALLFEYLLED